MRSALLMCAAYAASILSTVSVVHAVDAEFTVTDQVQVANPMRIGINLHEAGFKPWTQPTDNMWVMEPHPNSTLMRWKMTLFADKKNPDSMKTGPGFVERPTGLGFYDHYRNGFFEGASYIAYRYHDDQAECGNSSRGTVTKFINEGNTKKTGKTQRMEFSDANLELAVGDEVVFTHSFANPEADWFRVANKANRNNWMKYKSRASELDTTELAPGGGDASIKLSGPNKLIQQNYIGALAEHWIRMPEGKDFRFDIMLKQEGMTSGKVHVVVGGYKDTPGAIATHTFEAGTEWAKHSFDFVSKFPGKESLKGKGGGLSTLVIYSDEPGTLWIDNIEIYETNAEPGAIRPEAKQALADMSPGVMRIWTGQTNGSLGWTLDNWIADYADQQLSDQRGNKASARSRPNLPDALQLCKDLDAVPWLIVNVSFSPEEWSNLIEYLAGPADSPYGAKRAAAGRVEPWTDEFDKIYLEMGNETWSKIFRPWSWMRDVNKSAKYTSLMWDTAKKNPYFNDDKIDFIGTGWAANMRGSDPKNGKLSHGTKVAQLNKHAELITTAHYAGGFDGITLDAKGKDQQIFNRLYYTPRINKVQIDNSVDSLKLLGRNMKACDYESGPGYGIPSPGKKFSIEGEKVGKSLASAITTLDCYMYAQSQPEYGPIAFFGFNMSGINWSSHNPDLRPHITTLAITLRNQYCTGDMMQVEGIKVPTIDVPEAKIMKTGHGGGKAKEMVLRAVPNCPTVLCYPFKDGDHYSVMLISREQFDARTVKLNFPTEPGSTVNVHMLTHEDPWANNRETQQVELQHAERADGKNGYQVTLPPHSAMVVRFSK